MYISELTLENFRGFKNKTSICFNEGTNVIIGHNNAGKTSVIKALELLFDDKKSKRLSIHDFNRNIGIDELKEKPPKIRVAAKLTESKNDGSYSDDLVTVSKWLTKLETPYEALITYEFFLPQKEDPGFAGVFSAIFPGLGQIYTEQILKGLLFFVLSLIAVYFILSSFIEIFVQPYYASGNTILTIIFFVIYMIIWIIGISDAQKTARELNKN